MGILAAQKPVKLVMSLIFSDVKRLDHVEKELKERYGFLEPLERRLPFDYTDYYREEFGYPLMRKLICFNGLIPKEDISSVKVETNKIEDVTRVDGKRTVNIDPGYVTEAKLVLLTTKDYTHRVYIGNSIFAESTLHYRNGTFGAWPWTYPDYASPELISYFNEVRELYMRDIRDLSGTK